MTIANFRKNRDALEEVWREGKGVDGLLHRYSRLVDEFIADGFVRSAVSRHEERIALLALGGYGRRELFPRSDIDIMILYRPQDKEVVQDIADAVLYPLWDAGLEVGHGVRTVEESLLHAEEDYFFLVALLDARLIHGSSQLFTELLRAYRRRFVDGHRQTFVKKMKMFRRDRRARFGSHSYLLEPHIKEGRGGMRDIQAMMWTGSVVFGLDSLDDIESAGLLDDQERTAFEEAQSMIVRLRGYLHSLGRRKNDQLYFEHQGEIAGVFGYMDRDGVLAVERFMRDVYSALQTISVTSDMFFDHVDEVLGLVDQTVSVADREIEKGLEIKNGRVYLSTDKDRLRARPQMLLRVFLAMARTGLPMHHRSRKFVTANLGLITEKVRRSPRIAKTFFTLLSGAADIFLVLETMLETGVLVAYIPEFSRITTLAQHDLYHIYTVDRHSLQTVTELHLLMKEWGESVARNIINRNVLYIAALLHDIGKGSGVDHSLVGAEMVADIGRRLCLSREECDDLSFLVRYHLFIPENGLRRDLNDVVFIRKCAEIIGSTNRLSMLYLLSVADSKATGPSAWSDWKSMLMEEMYLKILPHLESHVHAVQDVAAHEEQGVAWLREQVRTILQDEKDLRVDVDTLNSDYILSFPPEMIAKHITLQRDKYQLIRQKSLVMTDEVDEKWSLLIMTTDRPGLLAKICGVMALNNLSVTKAQIFTWEDGTVVDVVDVQATDGLNFVEKEWGALNEQLNLAIEHRMGLSHRLYKKMSPLGVGGRKIVADIDCRVVVDNDSSESYSVVEVYAGDLPGNLYYITQAMADFGINIYKAYIATEVEQLIDVFYVLDGRGTKLLDEDYKQEVIQGILHSIGCVDR